MLIVVFSKNNIGIQIYDIILLFATGCGLDGRAPRLGRGGPQFESGHPDPSTHCRSLRVYDLMSRRALSLSKGQRKNFKVPLLLHFFNSVILLYTSRIVNCLVDFNRFTEL